MACNKTTLTTGLVAVLFFLASSCTSSSTGDTATSTPTPTTASTESTAPTEEPSTPVPAEEPTAVPTPTPAELTDDEMIAAARAAFDTEPRPGELIAWDHSGASVTGTKVQLELCTWTGETIFDSVRVAEYNVINTDQGIDVDYTFDSSIPGDCLNSELIDSALAATRDYDTFWGAVLEDPTTFDRDEAAQYLIDSQLDANIDLVATWTDEGTHWRGHPFDGDLPNSSLQPPLWRRYERDDLDLGILEIAVCRQLEPNYGLYRGDLLIDDERDENSIGSHAVDVYQMTRSIDGWLIAGGDGLGWAECLDTNWLDGVSQWQPDPTAWQAIR